MQLVLAMILHLMSFGVSGLLYSPIAIKYTGPLEDIYYTYIQNESI